MKRNTVVFHASDFPNMATHCLQAECGFSLYRGILVQWDEDQDERILSFVDSLPDHIRVRLLVAQEHEAALALRWKGPTPDGYQEGSEFDVDGDVWYVDTSYGLTVDAG